MKFGMQPAMPAAYQQSHNYKENSNGAIQDRS
jgi:hypothetical protein